MISDYNDVFEIARQVIETIPAAVHKTIRTL